MCSSDTAYEILSEVAQYPAFKPHEMEGFKDRLLLEMAYLTQKPEVKMMEGLHEMAFRASLGFSLYMPESSIGLHSSETLKQFTTVLTVNIFSNLMSNHHSMFVCQFSIFYGVCLLG